MTSRTKRILELAKLVNHNTEKDTESSLQQETVTPNCVEELADYSQNIDGSCKKTQTSKKCEPTATENKDIHDSDSEDPYATDEDDDYRPQTSSDETSPDMENNPEIQINNMPVGETDDTMQQEFVKGRKRTRNPEKWKRNIIKKLRNSGQEYTSWKNKTVPKRQLKDPCDSTKCRLKCTTKIALEDRMKIFKQYWNLENVDRQRDYIVRFVDFKEKKRDTRLNIDKAEKSRRNLTFTYFLPKVQEISERIQVCQTTFLNTLSISHQVVKTVAKKIKSSTTVSPDRRGRIQCNSKIPDNIKNTVREHIASFDVIDSHYCRRDSVKKYLPTSLNISRMYRLYKDYCNENHIVHYANEHLYRHIFNHEYNLSFFVPKKDQCDLCTKYENSNNEEKEIMDNDIKHHLKNKKLAREAKAEDKERGKIEKTFCVAIYDLQQVLPCPKAEVSQLYYKRKLSTYNLTIYDIANNKGYCFMWHEAIASRGACEVGSCVFDFIKMKVEEGVKEFVFYSDNCAGQNHNRFMYCMYMFCAHKYQINIRHNFLEKGHTQNEGDSVHSTIERASRNIAVYTPQQWYTIVRMACKKNPYIVKEMSQENIINLKDILQQTTKNWQNDTQRNKVFWQKVKVVAIKFDDPYILYFKYSYDEEFSVISCIERNRNKLTSFDNYITKRLYDKPLPISQAKYNDLQFMCAEKIIPNEYHIFFKNLSATANHNEREDRE